MGLKMGKVGELAWFGSSLQQVLHFSLQDLKKSLKNTIQASSV